MDKLITYFKYFSLIHFLLLVLFISSFNLKVQAQDKLVFSEIQDTFLVKVFEITDLDVSYKTWPPIDSSRFYRVHKKDLRFVILSNGSKLEFTKPKINLYKQNNFNGQRNNAIKFDPISILKSTNFFSYERLIKPGKSYEIGLGIIGFPQNGIKFKFSEDVLSYKGVTLSLGMKYTLLSPKLQIGNNKPHVLRGFYFKPELMFLMHEQENYYEDYYTKDIIHLRHLFKGAALLFNVGKQFVFFNRVCLDMHIGTGFGIRRDNITMLSPGKLYLPLAGYSEIGFIDTEVFDNWVVSGGVKFGYLLNPKYSNSKSKSGKK